MPGSRPAGRTGGAPRLCDHGADGQDAAAPAPRRPGTRSIRMSAPSRDWLIGQPTGPRVFIGEAVTAAPRPQRSGRAAPGRSGLADWQRGCCRSWTARRARPSLPAPRRTRGTGQPWCQESCRPPVRRRGGVRPDQDIVAGDPVGAARLRIRALCMTMLWAPALFWPSSAVTTTAHTRDGTVSPGCAVGRLTSPAIARTAQTGEHGAHGDCASRGASH